MTEPAADAPVPDAAPPEDLAAEAAELEARLASVRARAAAGGGETVRVKVEEPHVAFAHGHISVSTEYTDVPAHAVPAMMEAAANSGVTLTQEEV